MNGEKDVSQRMFVGRSSLQVGDELPRTFNHFDLPLELPKRERKREICFDHFRDGAASELMNDFNLGGMHFPEKNEPADIITQMSCKGVGCILKKCGLTITQYDVNGKVVSEMSVEQ